MKKQQYSWQVPLRRRKGQDIRRKQLADKSVGIKICLIRGGQTTAATKVGQTTARKTISCGASILIETCIKKIYCYIGTSYFAFIKTYSETGQR